MRDPNKYEGRDQCQCTACKTNRSMVDPIEVATKARRKSFVCLVARLTFKCIIGMIWIAAFGLAIYSLALKFAV